MSHVSTVHRRPLRARPISAAALTLAIACGATLGGAAVAEASTATTASTATIAAAAVFKELNAERAAHHLAAVRGDVRLVTGAHAHNLAMAKANLLSHQLPGELSPSARVTATKVAWRSTGENVAYSTTLTSASAVSLQKMMYAEVAPSDGHRRNILTGAFNVVGVDIYLDTVHHKLWLTEDFVATA